MYHLYIVECADHTLYTGIAKNLEQRVSEHNHSSRAAKYTRSRRPVKLVYAKRFKNQSTAQAAEFRIKSLSRLKKLALINK